MDSREQDLLFSTILDITSLARAERGETALFERVLDCSRELLRADQVMLLRVAQGRVERYALRGSGAALLHDELQSNPHFVAWLERAAAPFLGPAGEWHLPKLVPLLERSAASVLAVPLVTTVHQLGMLVALREHVPGGFGPAELKNLTVLASQTAVALENAELYQRLQREALVDGLTGILNYRSFIRALRSELRRARRYPETFAFVMADVDHLKTYNERFGHLAGSQVLVGVAQLLVGNCRGTDVVGKYGGDEFALILPQTDAEGARAVSDRMRLAIERHAFKHVRPGDVSCSFGVAVYPDEAHDVYGLIRQADGVLFTAKRSGKNRVLTTADLLDDVAAAGMLPSSSPHAS